MRKKMPELHGGDLVLVKWLDAAGHRDKDKADPIPCLSVGWIVEVGEKEGHKFLKLASELLLNDDLTYDTDEHVSIPEGMVQGITFLRRKMPKPFDKWGR